jgi:hypothetical protein
MPRLTIRSTHAATAKGAVVYILAGIALVDALAKEQDVWRMDDEPV